MAKKQNPTPPKKPAARNDASATGLPTLRVEAGSASWTVNAEAPSLTFVINAASILAGWNLPDAVARERAAQSSFESLVKTWHRLKARREENARLPKEEQQDPAALQGPSDPDKEKWQTPELQHYQFVSNDLRQHVEMNYWLVHAVLWLLPETYKKLRVARDFPRVLRDEAKAITPAIWAEARNEYHDILADAYTAAQKAAGPVPAGKANTMQVTWADEAPEYLLLSQARKLIDNQFSLQTLGRLCKPDGRIRYMRNGQRRKVHVADFLQYMKGQQSDPKWAAAYMNWLQGQKTGKTRWFWKCRNPACAHEYPEGANATDRCPKCKGECSMTLTAAPKPGR